MDYNHSEKSLRWLANQFQKIEEPKDDSDKIVNCIHLYCENGARAIADLIARAEEAEQRCKELEARCKRLDEVRERANVAAAKWEGIYRMALERAERAEETTTDICDDFTDFVTGGVHNAAPYCANRRPECVNAHGWCDGDNRVCRGFMPKAAVQKNEK